MNSLQFSIIVIYGLISLLVAIKGFYEVFKKNNPFGEPFILFWLGIFVWGDAVILGFFWFFVSLVCLIAKDWLLFLLIISVFWVIRSFSEVIYWINQQFSPIFRNPPPTLLGFHLFKNDSIWFVYQVIWQCLMVVSIITTIYLVNIMKK